MFGSKVTDEIESSNLSIVIERFIIQRAFSVSIRGMKREGAKWVTISIAWY
jgi:hypothetical protein